MKNVDLNQDRNSAPDPCVGVNALVIPRPATTKPIAIDGFCGEGGVSKGLVDAGFHVIGIDKYQKDRYPFSFYQADFLNVVIPSWVDLVWASPPCQGYCETLLARNGYRDYPLLIEPTREKLENSGKPYIIENVSRKPLRNPIMLCGTMFPNLRVSRHRYFESNLFLLSPPHERCPAYGKHARQGYTNGEYLTVTGDVAYHPKCAEAMGIDWMSKEGLSQAIPSEYAEFLGRQIIDQLALSQAV